MIFLLDVDEVLAEFTKAVDELAFVEHGHALVTHEADWDIFRDMTPELRAKLFKSIEAEGFCFSLQVCPGSQEGVRRLRSLGCNVYAVTSPWVGSPTWCYERMGWLATHFGIDSDHVIFAHDKYLVRGDFLLDDKPTNTMSWASNNPEGFAMLWNTQINAGRAYESAKGRVFNWGEVIGVVLSEQRRRKPETW